MRGNRKFPKKTRSQEQADALRQAPESDANTMSRVVPVGPLRRYRPGLGAALACAGCGRTKDLWEENNGEGLSKGGFHFCCRGCAIDDACTCGSKDAEKGQELNSLSRWADRRRR
jgi:hypothetical protein